MIINSIQFQNILVTPKRSRVPRGSHRRPRCQPPATTRALRGGGLAPARHLTLSIVHSGPSAPLAFTAEQVVATKGSAFPSSRLPPPPILQFASSPADGGSWQEAPRPLREAAKIAL